MHAYAGALLFAGYLVYDTFILIHILSPNQYIQACLMLYLDV
jgi:FtsH-binding integral membrane protein